MAGPRPTFWTKKWLKRSFGKHEFYDLYLVDAFARTEFSLLILYSNELLAAASVSVYGRRSSLTYANAPPPLWGHRTRQSFKMGFVGSPGVGIAEL